MRRLYLLAFIVAAPLAADAGVLDWLFPKHDVHVITVTDTTPEGALLRPASPEHPVYYVGINGGYRDLGGLVAGENPPPPAAMVKVITQVLAKQGYLLATREHRPTLVLVWTWGTMNADRMMAFDPDGGEGPQVNRRQLLRFLGGYKLGLVSERPGTLEMESPVGLIFRPADAELIYDLSREDLYVAAIGAYDYRAFEQGKKVVPLWKTKISCPSLGLEMGQTLPTMLAVAAPHIGRETPRPISMRAAEKLTPEVRVGTPKVVEESGRPTVDRSVPAAPGPAR